MKNVVIAGYVRSPFHFANKGKLARIRPDDLAAQVVNGLLKKTGVDPNEIEDIMLGCAFPEGEQGFNVAKLVGMLSNLPQSVAGTTINRFCGSSMQAIHMAAGAIQMDAGHAFIAGGIESSTSRAMSTPLHWLRFDVRSRVPTTSVRKSPTRDSWATRSFGRTRTNCGPEGLRFWSSRLRSPGSWPFRLSP